MAEILIAAFVIGLFQSGVAIYQTERQMAALQDQLDFEREEARLGRNQEVVLAQVDNYTELAIATVENETMRRESNNAVESEAIAAHSGGYANG